MSEAMTIPPLEEAPAKRVPTVYFIDDSATMREVIKIAFRRENIQVITCADAASALRQFEQMRSEEHTSELQSRLHLVCRLLLEKKKHSPATLHHAVYSTRHIHFTYLHVSL